MNKNYQIIRAPHQISFDITNKCNLRCLHCYNSSGENDVIADELTDNEVLNFIKSLQDMELYNVCFCGGEPLERKKILIDSINLLKENKETHCTMVTNGILLDMATFYKLVDAGLDGIQFSLDGLGENHDFLRNKNGAFEKVIDAISLVLNKSDLRLAISFTPTKYNISEFTNYYDFLTELLKNSNRKDPNNQIDLRSQPLMLLGRAINNDILPSTLDYRMLVNSINEINEKKSASTNIKVTWGDPVDHLLRYRDTSFVMDQCTIHANGDIVVSAYLPLIVGNIRKHSLAEYWDNGLSKIWTYDIVQYLVSKIKSINDMKIISNSIAKINYKDSIVLDLFENDLNDINNIKDIIFDLDS